MRSLAFIATLAAVFAAGASVPAAVTVIEGFESGNLLQYTTASPPVNATVSGTYAHDGAFGLGVGGQSMGWIYRNDVAAQVAQGDTLSAWVMFSEVADARAYFGFGAGPAGTLSFVLAPNSGDIRFQENPGFSFTELNSSPQTFAADKWYRAEVVWGIGGSLTGNLYDSDGATLLNSVASFSNLFTSGGIAFRGFDGIKAFDTITVDRETAIPEPASIVVWSLLVGMGLVGWSKRRRQG